MTEEEKKHLSLFNEKVEILRNCKFFQKEDGLKIDFTGEKLALKIGDKEPDEELIRSLLLCFRIFYVKGPVKFSHIHDILMKNVESEEKREFVKSLYKIYNRVLTIGSGFALKIDGKTVMAQRNIKSWLYGYYFKVQDKEREELEYLQSVTGDVVKFFFLREILTLVNIIVGLNEIVKEVLNIKK